LILIDNVVNSGLLRYVYETWPDQTWRGWHHYSDNVSEKYGSKSLRDLSSPVKECLYQMIDKIDFEAKYNDCLFLSINVRFVFNKSLYFCLPLSVFLESISAFKKFS